MMKVIKKVFGAFCVMACVLMMANHTYASNVIEVTPEIFVNINTEDGNGKTISGAKMKLYDSEGNLIDSWTSGMMWLPLRRKPFCI